MLQYSYKQESEIPEAIKGEYKRTDDGTWVLDGYAPKSKVDEFRDTSRALHKEKTQLQEQLLRFKGIDPEKYADAVQALEKLENERLEKAGEWKVLRANMEQAHNEALKRERERAQQIQEQWNREKIASQTALTVMKYAVPEEGNMKYIQNDLLELASIDPDTNDIVFFEDKERTKKRTNKDGNPVSLEEFLTTEYIPKSRLFKRSSGAGAMGSYDHIPMVSPNQVNIDHISGKNISGDMIEKLASGSIQAVS